MINLSKTRSIVFFITALICCSLLVSQVFSLSSEELNGAQTQQVHSALELSSSIIPLYTVQIAATDGSDLTPPTISNITQQPAHDSVNPDQIVTVSVTVTDDIKGVKEVILSHSVDGGETWVNAQMAKSSGDTYTAIIQGFEEGKQVTYKIIASDNINNVAVEDNAGTYYIYTVIPEFQAILLMFIVLTVVAVVFSKNRKLLN